MGTAFKLSSHIHCIVSGGGIDKDKAVEGSGFHTEKDEQQP